jgi:hypothetical protein
LGLTFDPAGIPPLLQPLPPEVLEAVAASRQLNNPKNDGPETADATGCRSA